MPTGVPADPSFYYVRIPHYVLVHGQQLRDGTITQKAVWEAVHANKGHVQVAMAKMRSKGYLNPRAPLSFGPEMGGVVGVCLGAGSLRAAWFDANGEQRAVHTAPYVEQRLKRQSPNHTIDDVARAVNAVLTLTLEAANREQQKSDAAADRHPLFVERLTGGEVVHALPLLAVAVAWPMPLNRYTKQPVWNSALHDQWHGKPLPSILADRLGLPERMVHAVNDANAAATAAAFDDVRSVHAVTSKRKPERRAEPEWPPAHVSLTIRVGGGVGAGTLIVQAYDPTSFKSFNEAVLVETELGLAGELGHQVVDSESVEVVNEHRGSLPEIDRSWACSCGGKGHLEALASVSAFIKRLGLVEDGDLLREIGLDRNEERPVNLMHDAIRRIEEGSPDSILWRALKDMGLLIGRACAGTVLTLAPSTITLTGSAACEPLKEGFTQGISERGGFFLRADQSASRRIQIDWMKDERNRLSPARGAALVVFRETIYRNLKRFEMLLQRHQDDASVAGTERHIFAGEMLPLTSKDLPLCSRPPR